MTFWIHIAGHVVRAIAESQKKPAAVPPPKRRRPAPATTTARVAIEDKILMLDLRREPTQGARDLRLRTSGGEAWLVLCDLEPGAAETGAGHDAVLEVRDRRKGAALLAALARWLGVKPPLPPYPQNPLRPFALRWSRVAEVAGAERISLRLAWNGRAAELFVDLGRTATTCLLVQDQPASRADLVAILAVALRDGAPA